MTTDLTFITNEPPARRSSGAGGEANLLNRFKVLVKDAKFFDSLVGYFYIRVGGRRYRRGQYLSLVALSLPKESGIKLITKNEK